MVTLRNPDAKATARQLYKLAELSGEDTRGLNLTMQQASDRIDALQLKSLVPKANDLDSIDDDTPFNEAHVTIVLGDQRGGKTVYAVAKIKDSYFNDAVEIYCHDKLGISCQAKAFYSQDRVAKIKHDGKIKLVPIPQSYKLWSPMRIFSDIHLYGFPYVYIPSFRHMLAWLKSGFISDGWLLADEAYRGMSARGSMTAEGREWVGEYFQFGKSKLDVIMITHHARMVDYLARLVPTKRVECRYDAKTCNVYYTLKQKGVQGTIERHFFAPPYWGNYRTNEKVKA